MRLHPSLTLQARIDEPPASYLSCVSRRIGRAPASLAREMGTTYKNIVDGDSDAIARLIHACRLPEDAFAKSTIVKLGQNCRIGAEAFPPHGLRRSSHFVCPICVREDLADGSDARAQVLPNLTVVHACPKHRALYARTCSSTDPRLHYDFAWHFQQALDRGLLSIEPEFVASVGDSAGYLADRIRGVGSDSWLDSIPAFTVARFAEVLGLEMMFREVREWKSVSAAEWHDAGNLGFRALAAGQEGVRTALAGIGEMRSGDFRLHTWQEVYGNLHGFLARGNKSDSSLDLFRHIAHEHVVQTTPVGLGDWVFGLAVKERKVHSILTASAECGIHPATLRGRLQRLGVVGPHVAGQGYNTTFFDAQATAVQLRVMREYMSRTDALDYLDLIRPMGEAVLAPEFIPHVDVPGTKGRRAKGYLKVDLDGFIGRLVTNARVPKAGDELVPIRLAVQPARTPFVDILRLILSGKLCRVGHRKGERGLSAVLVDPREVMALTHALPPGRVSIPTAADLLGYSYRLVLQLVDAGLIASRPGRNSVTGLPRRTVAVADIEAFDTEYVSLYHLAAKMGKDPRLSKTAMRQVGVLPALTQPISPATFYRRRDVDRYLRNK